jgi:hypothetical protein
MRIRLGSISLLVVLAMTSVLSPSPATACDGCADNKCTGGFDQGTFGCTSGEMSCSLIQKLTVGCEGRYCSTSGNLACDNRLPVPPAPVEPIKASSAGQSHPKPAAPLLPEGSVAEALTCGTALDPPLAAQHD